MPGFRGRGIGRGRGEDRGSHQRGNAEGDQGRGSHQQESSRGDRGRGEARGPRQRASQGGGNGRGDGRGANQRGTFEGDRGRGEGRGVHQRAGHGGGNERGERRGSNQRANRGSDRGRGEYTPNVESRPEMMYPRPIPPPTFGPRKPVQLAWDEEAGSLLADLHHLDGADYSEYKKLMGKQFFHNEDWRLEFASIQVDPYAPPSRIRIVKPKRSTTLSWHLRRDPVATCDFATRLAAAYLREKGKDPKRASTGWSGVKGFALTIDAPGQEVLRRTSCMYDPKDQYVELRLSVALPAKEKAVLGKEAWKILGENLPALVRYCLAGNASFEHANLSQHVQVVQEQNHLRSQLQRRSLVAFVADGSILPRESGATALPMDIINAVKLQCPEASQAKLEKRDGTVVTGLGIKRGVTILTGGSFHGKSTLLEAIQMGVYNHIPGDGRELVVTDPNAFKVRAESGRSVSKVDISPFINNLPEGRSTTEFITTDASGATGMAASIQEALEAGCTALLVDEDSAATDLMFQDSRMRELVASQTITPLLSRVRALSEQREVSTVIATGAASAYLRVADHVIGMQQYQPVDLTERAAELVKQYPTDVSVEDTYGNVSLRLVLFEQTALGSKTPQHRGKTFIRIWAERPTLVRNKAEEEEGIDLSSLEQLVEPGQAHLIAEYLAMLRRDCAHRSIQWCVQDVVARLRGSGLDGFGPGEARFGDLVEVRPLEIAAAINRIRGLRVGDEEAGAVAPVDDDPYFF